MMDEFWFNNNDLTKKNTHDIRNETLRVYASNVQNLRAYTMRVHEYQNRKYMHINALSFLIFTFTEHKSKQTKLLVSTENENTPNTVQIIT